MTPKYLVSLALLAAAAPLLAARGVGPSGATPPPATPKRPVVTDYHGTKVTDDYRWLEADDAEVKKWSEAQHAHARAVLDGLPQVAAIRTRVTELMKAASVDYTELRYVNGVLFAFKFQPPKNQDLLVTFAPPVGDAAPEEHVVLDPNVLDESGRTTIDFFVPSPDGTQVAISLSSSGTESGTVHVYDVATGKETGDVVPRVNGGTAGGSVAWADNRSFYYTRYPRGAERPPVDLDFYQQIYLHQLGTPTDKDAYSAGRDFPRIAEVKLVSSPDGKYTVAAVANGDGGQVAYNLRGPGGKWTALARYEDKILTTRFGADGTLYLLSRKDAPRGRILSLLPGLTSLARAVEVVPQTQAVIEDFAVTPGRRLYVASMVGGPFRLDVYENKKATELAILPVSTVDGVVALDGNDVLYRNESFIDPPAWIRYSAADDASQATALRRTFPGDLSKLEVVRDEAVSKDGTKVPMSIVRRKGLKLDGQNPTLMWAYGGYGISQTPHVLGRAYPFVEQGGVYVVAHIRGGGELGEEWHLGGNLTHKQKDYDDFYACAQRLVETKVTSPGKLAIMGGSNGGLLMGAVMTQHPEAYGAVVAMVGIFDMLRFENDTNGAFNVTEFGTVTNKEQFEAMYAYSPLQHVKDGTAYPPTLFLTGANDPRVPPYHSRKMLARLQAASSSKAPLLLRVNPNAGHGIGAPLADRIDENVDIMAFLCAELGVTYKAPPRGK